MRTKFQAEEEEEAEEGDKAMAWSDLFGVQLLEKILWISLDHLILIRIPAVHGSEILHFGCAT